MSVENKLLILASACAGVFVLKWPFWWMLVSAICILYTIYGFRKGIENKLVVFKKVITYRAKEKVETTRQKQVNYKWISPGTPRKIGEFIIQDGMFYIGDSSLDESNQPGPSMIVPSKAIRPKKNAISVLSHSPNYSRISREQRWTYLQWLAQRRLDPYIDIGYVFMFFYGLEYRVIIENTKNSVGQVELLAIEKELKRLLTIYGSRSKSFHTYATELLQFIQCRSTTKLYETTPPQLKKKAAIPLYIRVMLGQLAEDEKCVSPKLAYAWLTLSERHTKRSVERLLPRHVEQLFEKLYNDTYPKGMPLNKTTKNVYYKYKPASASLESHPSLGWTFDNTPDVAASNILLTYLEKLLDTTLERLSPYSRLVTKAPDTMHTIEALILLPYFMWPPAMNKRLDSLLEKVDEELLVLPLQDLLTLFDATNLDKAQLNLFIQALSEKGIGVEPDILNGQKKPKITDDIVLFRINIQEEPFRMSNSYKIALLTLKCASAVAATDGEIQLTEVPILQRLVRTWPGLLSSQKARLNAYLSLTLKKPAPIASLKAEIECLNDQLKKSVLLSLAHIAKVDNWMSPPKIKILDKIYKMFGYGVADRKIDLQLQAPLDLKIVKTPVFNLDKERIKSIQQETYLAAQLLDPIFEERIVAPTQQYIGPLWAPVENEAAPEPIFVLDMQRIKSIQMDTEQVSKILTTIFEEYTDEPQQSMEQKLSRSKENEQEVVNLTNAEKCNLFIERITSKPEWRKEELKAIATELDIMLDGTLESLNDTALDEHDMLFTEGDDIITVNLELKDKLKI